MQAREALYKKKKSYKKKLGNKFGLAGKAIGGVADNIGKVGHVISYAGSGLIEAADAGVGAVTNTVSSTIHKVTG